MKSALFWWLVSSAAAVADTPGMDPADDFSPMLFMMAMMAFAMVFVLVGVGIVLATVVVAAAAGLAAIGVISSAALIGILRRKVSAGVRALHYQVFALAGLPAGMGLVWLGGKLFHSTLSAQATLAIGACSGISAGLLLAFMLDRLVCLLQRRLG